MDVPDLVRESLGDEEITASVNLGDEDAVCATPSRTLLYRGEGLLSDESVQAFPHDIERMRISEGRRKTKFVLEYVDRKEELTVPGSRAGRVLEMLMEGMLQSRSVIEPADAVAGVFRFSELTLVVTGTRMLKHVGAPVWDPDFEEFPYEHLTQLDFEEGSVATQLVLIVDGRPERIKAPNEQAPQLRQTLERAVFDFYDVDSLEALNERVGEEEPESAQGEGSVASNITLESGIDPLVSGDAEVEEAAGDSPDDTRTGESAEAAEPGSAGTSGANGEAITDAGGETATVDRDPSSEASARSDAGERAASVDAADTIDAAEAASRADVDALVAEVDELRDTVERQNAILKKQHETLRQLIEELRQGRGG
jgi:hypothetical protein